MVRAFLITILLSTAVWANDIYVEQAQVKTRGRQGRPGDQVHTGAKNCCHHSALKKTKQYCSVVAGCYTVNN
jgi:hypothetical protein